jgi:prevent-host-death family protein
MRDHIDTATSDGRNSVGVRELKTHAARILRRVRETKATYVLTHHGRPIGVILPVDGQSPAVGTRASDAVDGWGEFLKAGRRLQGRFRPCQRGVRQLSTSRR